MKRKQLRDTGGETEVVRIWKLVELVWCSRFDVGAARCIEVE